MRLRELLRTLRRIQKEQGASADPSVVVAMRDDPAAAYAFDEWVVHKTGRGRNRKTTLVLLAG